MTLSGTPKGVEGPDVFTPKQRRVLDLLIEHKTSKEIARELDISPYTVDQRIALARAKLGVSSRNELAARYRDMRKIDGTGPYMRGGSELEHAADDSDEDVLEPSNVNAAYENSSRIASRTVGSTPDGLQNVDLFCPTDNQVDYRVGPEMFEGKAGGLWRLGAIVATALLLVMTILGLFAIFDQLNSLLA